jgi:hypothetical protein
MTIGLVEACFSQLVISEFLAANRDGLEDEDGDRSDWIEILNSSAFAIELDGWTLTDLQTDPGRWTFPGKTLGTH